ncbi:MAG: outer membrane lipoprotein carrier protein LolA [Prevotella sp.]|nr:outer membrane lipoprotein carrier protein LolA [Bacteroides sp.]MCM1365659.1 outer membrane lipoprotein carrier protein LolA [Prevotella sp.]
MKKLFKRYTYTILRAILAVVIISVISIDCYGAQTAQQQLKTAVNKYLKGGISVTFSYSGAMGNGNGSLKSNGKKFALQTSSGSVWYNGINMWTYSPSTKETTLVRPTQSELAEANPITVLGNSTSTYSATFAKKQNKGSSTIVLTPRIKNSGIKRVVVILDAKLLSVKKIEVTSSDGNKTILNIKSLVSNQRHADTNFEYPSKKYPKVKVVDLR